MDFLFILVFLFILIYSITSIYQDIKLRKVKNIVNLSFLFFCFLFFIFYFKNLDIFDYSVIFITLVVSYFIYVKDLWGAADGKIFIGLILVFISTFGLEIFLDYVVNLFLIYSFTIIIISQIKTSKKNKSLVLKNKIKYDEILFVLILSFIIISIVYSFINPTNLGNYFLLLIFGIFVLIYFLTNFAKKYYRNILKNEKITLNILFGFLLIFLNFNNFSFLFYFILIYFFRIFVEYISELSDKIIHNKRKKYQSPFMIYLFLVALITIIIQKNIILIIFEFFKF